MCGMPEPPTLETLLPSGLLRNTVLADAYPQAPLGGRGLESAAGLPVTLKSRASNHAPLRSGLLRNTVLAIVTEDTDALVGVIGLKLHPERPAATRQGTAARQGAA